MKQILNKPSKRKFIDTLRIYAKGGAGGNGNVKHGGRGGAGGSVYAVCTDKGLELHQLKQKQTQMRFSGGKGTHSTIHRLLGASGNDVELQLAPGIKVLDEEGQVVGELEQPGDRVLIAEGGSAGGSQPHNYLGQKGDVKMSILDLTLIADVGLVGFPNAGKSSLLRRLTKASPKVAPFPFTTMQPSIGTIKYPDLRSVTVADLPGIIEGAHANVGLGYKFLKHIERTKLLLFVVDVFGFQLGIKHPYRTPFETLMMLNKEIELYNPALLEKPALLCINKMDRLVANENREESEETSEKGTQLLQDFEDKINNFESSIQEMPDIFRPKRLLTFDEILKIHTKGPNETDNMDFLKTQIRDVIDRYHPLPNASGTQQYTPIHAAPT